jgi:hypothetical protein
LFNKIVWVEGTTAVGTGAFDFEVFEEVDAMGDAATVGAG